MLLPDNETKIDLLNNEAIASTIVNLLQERPEHPVTIGVHGDWGAGKSSILEMLEAQLSGKENILCLKFNGWRFQGFEDAKIALIEGIVTGLLDKRPLLSKASGAVKEVFKRIDWLKVAKKAGGLAFTAMTGLPNPALLSTAIEGLKKLAASPSSLLTSANIQEAANNMEGLLRPGDDSKNVPQEAAEFRKAFDDLLKEAHIDQLVVLIDDLDRCLPDTAIETLEAIRLFVFTPRTAFVVAADETMIEYAVRKHFPDLTETTGPRGYARNYLEKLIQVPFRIPALGDTETRIYVTLLLVAGVLGEDNGGFKKLLEVSRARLKRPWQEGALDATTIDAALGDETRRVRTELELSDQIGPVLAAGTHGNPRQIKRFLNALLLRKSTAEARGFDEEVKLPVLAKLMLAEQFNPPFFDYIASVAAASPTGHCPDLVEMETAARVESTSEAPAHRPKQTTKSASSRPIPISDLPKVSENKNALDWLSSEQVLGWMRISPPLGDVDLRPYLFVAKDKKDYFGATSALGHLSIVVERLLGPKMQVQVMRSELATLSHPEAIKVFEGLRIRVMSAGSWKTAPAGVEGLLLLVKTHERLESDLNSFLEKIPTSKVGVWVVSGWSDVIKTAEGKARFQKLLEQWKVCPNNKPLNLAAGTILGTLGSES